MKKQKELEPFFIFNNACLYRGSVLNVSIFDPFSGSGTTVLTAALNKRVGIGLDIDLTYCELAKNRILQELNTFDFDEESNEKCFAKWID